MLKGIRKTISLLFCCHVIPIELFQVVIDMFSFQVNFQWKTNVSCAFVIKLLV